MRKKFAYFTFPNSVSEIRLKYEFIKKLPKSIYYWYIKRYCPFYIKDTEVFGINGFEVVMPLTKDELNESTITEIIFYNTLHYLTEQGVGIVIPPKEYPVLPDIIKLADAYSSFIFLLPAAITKALKTINKQFKSAEIFIIDGDYDLVEAALYILHKQVNFISVATDEPKKYEGICKDILEETGLNVQILPLTKSCFKNKDIYIKTSSNKGAFDYSFDRGSAVIDLSKDFKELSELISKRNDVLIFDGAEVKYLENYYDLYMFDIILNFSCTNYKRYLSGRYDLYDLDEVITFVEHLGFTISAFCQSGVPIKSGTLEDIIKRSISI